MKSLAKLFFTITLLFCVLPSIGQINPDLKDELSNNLSASEIENLNIADSYFNNKEFLLALPIYDSLYQKNKSNLYLTYLLGTCYAYDAQNQKNSEGFIRSALTIKNKLLDFDYYLGKACLENEKYDEAIVQFESYLKNPLREELQLEVKRQIGICKYAKESLNKLSLATITNIGTPINTKGSEYCPVFPSDERFMVFTYRGEKSKGGKQSLPGKKDPKKGIYFEDVFISYKGPRGEWSEPFGLDAINTNGHDAAIFISQDGQRLFIYRNTDSGNGDIYESKSDGTSWSKPQKVKGINSKSWEGSVCLAPDQKTIYFSSERPGGIGGRDIYFAQLLPDGSWGEVKNLGTEINTKFDEDAPFVHSDGKTLFFASKGHKTLGGYDIFRSELKEGKWGKPINLGKPINTNGDDKFYVVSSDGQKGYYSSEQSGGMGQQDIYTAEPGMFGKPTSLVLVTGIVTYNDKPVEATIKVKSKLYQREYTRVKAEETKGDYLVNLPSGNDFEITYSYRDISQTKTLSTALIDSFARIEMNTQLYTESYIKSKMPKPDSLQIKPEDIGKKGLNFDEFVAKYGDKMVDSLDYRVQIGAYRYIENFNHSILLGLPRVLRKTYHDGITRFTIGEQKSLNDAVALCNKVKKKGIKDAFIIAIYKDERIFFDELLNSGIIEK